MLKLDRTNTDFAIKLTEYLKGIKRDDEFAFLKYHQEIVRIYDSHINTYGRRGILIYHEMGFGKSWVGVALAIEFAFPNVTTPSLSGKQPILLMPKSLHTNFKDTIKKYILVRSKTNPDWAIGRLPANELDKWIDKNFSFISMGANNMSEQISRATAKAATEFGKSLEKKFGKIVSLGSLDNKILILDEAHNFFRAVTNGSKNAISLCNMIKRAKGLHVVFMTGTPLINDPFELSNCFNMLVEGQPILPEFYSEFNKLYVDSDLGRIKNKEMFQNRIFGLVSYIGQSSKPGASIGYVEQTKVEFPKQLEIIVEKVPMDREQLVYYHLAREKEKEENTRSFGKSKVKSAMTKPKGKSTSTYRVKSRQLSNYCAPEKYQKIDNFNKIPDNEIDSPKYRQLYKNLVKHKGQLGIIYSQFISMGGLGTLEKFLRRKGWKLASDAPKVDLSKEEPDVEDLVEVAQVPLEDDKLIVTNEKSGEGEDEDDELYAELVDGQYIGQGEGPGLPSPLDFIEELEKKVGSSELFSTSPFDDPDNWSTSSEHDISSLAKAGAMDTDSSTRMTIDNLQRANSRESLFLGEFPSIEGVTGSYQPHSEYIGSGKENRMVDDRKDYAGTYAIITGAVPLETRMRLVAQYVAEDNMRAEKIDLLLISSTGAEGLDLKNVRHVHVLEPYWNWARIAQVIARAVRAFSHVKLPESERNVQPYIYLAINPDADEVTTDLDLYAESLNSLRVNESFLTAMKEVSIECLLNDHEGSPIKCYSCSPNNASLFSNDPLADINSVNPCSQYSREEKQANEIEIDGKKYFYSEDNKNVFGFNLFYFDETVNAYRKVSERDPTYQKAADMIGGQSLDISALVS